MRAVAPQLCKMMWRSAGQDSSCCCLLALLLPACSAGSVAAGARARFLRLLEGPVLVPNVKVAGCGVKGFSAEVSADWEDDGMPGSAAGLL